MNKFVTFLFFLLNFNSIGYAMDAEIPDYIRAIGITRCTDFRAPRGFNDPHPILSYQLDTESVAVMNARYQVARQAIEKGQDTLAVKILWDLAENGYAPANRELLRAFLHGRLGLKKDHKLTRIFSDRPSALEDMIQAQKGAQYTWENRETIREGVRQAQEFFRASLGTEQSSSEKGKSDSHDDVSTEATTRDSGSSIESALENVYSPLQDGDLNQTRSASHVSAKKKEN